MTDLKSLPEWAPFAIIGGVVLLLVMNARGSGGGGGGVGSVTTLAPAPADPGVVSIMTSEISAREHGFDSLIGLFSSQVESDRDVNISRLNADSINQRTAAQLEQGLYAESVRHDLGLSATSAAVAIENARAAAQVSIVQSQGASAKAVADSQGATAKYVAKKQNNPWNTFIKSAGDAIGKIFGH